MILIGFVEILSYNAYLLKGLIGFKHLVLQKQMERGENLILLNLPEMSVDVLPNSWLYYQTWSKSVLKSLALNSFEYLRSVCIADY